MAKTSDRKTGAKIGTQVKIVPKIARVLIKTLILFIYQLYQYLSSKIVPSGELMVFCYTWSVMKITGEEVSSL